MTEGEHIKLVEVGNYFWDELGKLIAKCLNDLPPKMDKSEALAYLQDKCSVYGTDYQQYLRFLIRREASVNRTPEWANMYISYGPEDDHRMHAIGAELAGAAVDKNVGEVHIWKMRELSKNE